MKGAEEYEKDFQLYYYNFFIDEQCIIKCICT